MCAVAVQGHRADMLLLMMTVSARPYHYCTEGNIQFNNCAQRDFG